MNAPAGELPEIVKFHCPAEDTAADIVHYPALVVAGRGACDRSTLPLLEELARLVGGVVACSSPVVQAGLCLMKDRWARPARQSPPGST